MMITVPTTESGEGIVWKNMRCRIVAKTIYTRERVSIMGKKLVMTMHPPVHRQQLYPARPFRAAGPLLAVPDQTLVITRPAVSEAIHAHLSSKPEDPDQEQEQEPFPPRWNDHGYAHHNHSAEDRQVEV